MAAQAAASLDSLPQLQHKNALSPLHTASERLDDDSPAHEAPASNGFSGNHVSQSLARVEPSSALDIQDSASAIASNPEQLSLPSPLATVDPTASTMPSQGPSHTEPRGSAPQKDQDGNKSGPSSSSTSPTQPSSPSHSHNLHQNSSSTEKANGAGSHKPPVSHTSKLSFWSRLLRIFVPCIYPSPSTHPIEVPESASISGFKEKQPSTSVERVVRPTLAPPTISVPKEAAPPAPVTEESATLISVEPIHDTSTSDDDDVPIQPTPPSAPHILPLEETEGVTSGAVQAPGSTGGSPPTDSKRHSRESTQPSAEEESEGTSFTEDDDIDGLDEIEDDEDRLIMNGGAGIPIGPDGIPRPLLPPIAPQHAGRKCLILDLDETLVHSSFKSIQQADYVVPVEIEYHLHNVYVIKRPGVDKFLKKMGEIYEIVVFTASLSKYADPVLDKLDINQVVSHRLFRESCYNHRGNYVKDLSQLGRPVGDTIILDNSPASYIFHPNNAVPVSSWFNDPHDTELTDLVPFLTDLATVDDVRGVLDGAR